MNGIKRMEKYIVKISKKKNADPTAQVLKTSNCLAYVRFLRPFLEFFSTFSTNKIFVISIIYINSLTFMVNRLSISLVIVIGIMISNRTINIV